MTKGEDCKRGSYSTYCHVCSPHLLSPTYKFNMNNECMKVSMHAYMYLCLYVLICVSACLEVCICSIFIPLHLYVCIYVCVFNPVRIHESEYICTWVCLSLSLCKHVHTGVTLCWQKKTTQVQRWRQPLVQIFFDGWCESVGVLLQELMDKANSMAQEVCGGHALTHTLSLSNTHSHTHRVRVTRTLSPSVSHTYTSYI